jgi:hypothetical protein
MQLGGAGPLIALSGNSNIHAQCMALASLRRLAMYPDNRPRLIRAGVIEPIVVGARSPEVRQREKKPFTSGDK